MKNLMRRLSKVADSSTYYLLRSNSRGTSKTSKTACVIVPQGHIPVYVGDDSQRFVVSAELLNHSIFVRLLNRSAKEYGYGQRGVLRIPCHVFVFERVLEGLRIGSEECDLHDMLN